MEEARVGEHWGFGYRLPAESSFVYTPAVYGGRAYTRSRQHWRRLMLPEDPPPPSPALDQPDGSEEESTSVEGEGEFQGPVSIYEYGSALRRRRQQQQQQQGKRGRVTASSEAAILRLLHEVTPTAGCSDCCAICLGDFADAAAAADPPPLRAMPSCSHAFHQHCILKWLRLNATCPVCRRQLPLSQCSTEEEDDWEEEEQARRSSSRRRNGYDDWLALVARHTRERQRQTN